MTGQAYGKSTRRKWLDWTFAAISTLVILTFALMARPPIIHVSLVAAIGLILAMSILLFACGLELWKITKFG